MEEADVEHIVDVPVPQFTGEILEVVENIPKERISERTMEQTVDVPVPHVELAVSAGVAGSSRAGKTRPVPTLQQSQSLLVKLGLRSS